MAFRSVGTGSRIKSPVTELVYTLHEMLGEGAFGAAYRAHEGGDDVCVKITDDNPSWHREAYMAELLRGHPNVVQVREAFPLIRKGVVLYAVAMELATGTVGDAIAEDIWPWTRVRTQIRGLLSALSRLHDSGAVHRDVTPYNVFVCGPNRKLKLGDFGIARHGWKKKGVPAYPFNPDFVDPLVYAGYRPRWTPSDDLWQVAQVAAVLLTGEMRVISTNEVKDLPCGDAMKLAIRRAIGEEKVRFRDAQAMSAALAPSYGLTFGNIRSLSKKTIVFTGPLGGGFLRRDATALAVEAGATVLDVPSSSMDVLVIGDTSPNWIAGTAGGVKVLETLALQERGHRITLIDAEKFKQLVPAV